VSLNLILNSSINVSLNVSVNVSQSKKIHAESKKNIYAESEGLLAADGGPAHGVLPKPLTKLRTKVLTCWRQMEVPHTVYCRLSSIHECALQCVCVCVCVCVYVCVWWNKTRRKGARRGGLSDTIERQGGWSDNIAKGTWNRSIFV